MNNYEVTGRIFDIQKYSIHDGPGIRTIVFFKGCILRCKWCCNPESQSYDIQSMNEQGKVKVVGRDVTVEQVMQEVRKDAMYYRKSGGGVTLSGGEVLCQPVFAKALLEACHEEGFHTAIETSASVEFSVFSALLPYVDCIMMDIKHMDTKKHNAFTGKGNELVLENIKKLSHLGIEVIVRIPLIPEVNATVEEVGEIAQFASGLTNVSELHLLPYHRFGTVKYEGLHRSYEMGEVPLLEQSVIEKLLEEAKKSGLTCQIGG